MLYELVENSYASLAQQWRDLVSAFNALAESLPRGDPRRGFLGNQVDPAVDPPDFTLLPPPPAGQSVRPIIGRCFAEQSQLERDLGQLPLDWAAQNPPQSALDLFRRAATRFRDSQARLTPIYDHFQASYADPTRDTADMVQCRLRLEQTRLYIGRGLQEFEEVTSDEGQRFSIKGIGASVDNLASYPILTTDMMVTPAPAAPPAVPGALPIKRTVDNALREVLGRLPKPNDTRSFLVALNQSFQLQAVEGHTVWTWTPRSYAGQTDLGGGVTGAQASLYSRAREALDSSLPLLGGLFPLRPDYDPEEADAARAIVQGQLGELVNELGVEGGPRIQRVDTLFELLLNQETTSLGGETVRDGKLGYLQHVLGLYQNRVNTLEEETNVTNFIVLQDYIVSLRASWEYFRDRWYGRDLGTRLTLLSRALSVVAESVDEVYAAMDSVFVGSAERQVASFNTRTGRRMLVEELMSWIVSFASDEAPRLVHEGGRRGVEAIVPTVLQLENLVHDLLDAVATDPSLPDGLRHPRVRHPLQEIRGYLLQVQRLAQDVRHVQPGRSDPAAQRLSFSFNGRVP